MKYIRTKNGIILNPAPFDCGNNEYGLYNGESARQAGTIEELCDEFVAIRKDGVKFLVEIRKAKHGRILAIKTDLFIWKKPLIKSIKKEFQVYGAIWTDKGLIYVAKMNKKGEFELL